VLINTRIGLKLQVVAIIAQRSVTLCFLQGARDFVTAGHIRTDKTHCGPGYNTGSGCVTFAGPHRQRQLRGGGNVWQHLRSFRKHLFDAVPDDRLRMFEDPTAAAAAAGVGMSDAAAFTRSGATAATNDSSSSFSTNLAGCIPPGSSVNPAKQQQEQSIGPGSSGYYYELANDWAFAVPMAELAEKPGVLPAALYLYEPSWPRQDRPAREAVIGGSSL
jgi:hypothetical protein